MGQKPRGAAGHSLFQLLLTVFQLCHLFFQPFQYFLFQLSRIRCLHGRKSFRKGFLRIGQLLRDRFLRKGRGSFQKPLLLCCPLGDAMAGALSLAQARELSRRARAAGIGEEDPFRDVTV